MWRTYGCPHSRTSCNISSNLQSTLAESALIWSAISIMHCLMSTISRLIQSASSSVKIHCRFEGRWLALSRDSALRFPAELGTSYKSLIRWSSKDMKHFRYLGLMDSNLNGIENILVSKSFLWPSRTRQLRWWVGRSKLFWRGLVLTARWFVVGKIERAGRRVTRDRSTLTYSKRWKTYVIRV